MTAQFDRIRKYIRKFDGDDFVSIESGRPATEAEIAEIAEAFSFPLPQIFHEYLTTFGTLVIGGIEFAGASEANFLNVVRIRDRLVSSQCFPNNLIPLENQDGDSYVCLRADEKLVRWYPNTPHMDVLNETLEAYLLRLCDEHIEDEAEELEE